MYIVLRFSSVKAYMDWKYIEPWYFYSLFATETYIVVTLLLFLWYTMDSQAIEFDDELSEEHPHVSPTSNQRESMVKEVEIEGDDLFNAQ